jgi:hypothetical protein
MREEGGTYSIIAVGVTERTFTVTGLTLGVTYEFTIEAKNSVGFGPASAALAILHAIPPEQPSAPTSTNSG